MGIIDQTPKELSLHIKTFCKAINPSSVPSFLAVAPEEGAEMIECFHNVETAVAKFGGEVIYGWAIWTWPKVWLKAEHHAVWRRPDGTTVDITPHSNNETSVLFLPDPTAVYDFINNKRRNNIRKALKSDLDIKALFEAETTIWEYEEACSVPGTREMSIDPRKHSRLSMEKDLVLFKLIDRYWTKSAACYCGSGAKFSSCCKSDIDMAAADNFRIA
jgi:hypothetical protein